MTTHIVVGLFERPGDADEAVGALKGVGFARDVSVISKDAITGKVTLYQAKQQETEGKDEAIGAEIGTVAGVLGGLSAVLNPALASPAIIGVLAVTMGVVGAALGEAVGGYIGDLHHADLPPERAKIYKDKIHGGQVFIAVAVAPHSASLVKNILATHHAIHVHTIEHDH